MNLRLKEIRKIRDLTQREVAEALGVSPATYSRYETGEREPSIDTLVRLSSIYGVSVDFLVNNVLIESSVLNDYEKTLVEASREVPEYVRKDVLDFLRMKRSSDRD